MTFEMKLRELLIESGMFEDQAEEVLVLVKEENPSMNYRWSDSIKDYPSNILTVLWLSTKTIALRYIEENIPGAWYKPMFM